MNSLEIKTINLGELMYNKVSNAMKYKYNGIISDMLSSPWLDKATIQTFIKEQTILQAYPYSLATLVNKIQVEIESRIKIYGT